MLHLISVFSNLYVLIVLYVFLININCMSFCDLYVLSTLLFHNLNNLYYLMLLFVIYMPELMVHFYLHVIYVLNMLFFLSFCYLCFLIVCCSVCTLYALIFLIFFFSQLALCFSTLPSMTRVRSFNAR